MSRLVPRLMLVAVFSASAALADAQAVHRGGGGSSSSSSGSSSSGGGSSSSGGGSTYSAPSPSSSAPVRSPSHGSDGGSSVSRGSGSSGSNAGTATVRRPDGGSTSAATAPTYSRPDGTHYNGYAVPRARTSRPPVYYYPPIYINPWYFGSFGYGYGLSYFYDPFYDPFGYGGYGYGPGMGYGYGPGMGYYGYGSGSYDTWDTYNQRAQEPATGKLRIKVKPREARVMVDGAFVGTVDDFDGFFQKLTLPEGRHQVVLQLDGYETLSFEVMIIAGQTVNYKGEMHKLPR